MHLYILIKKKMKQITFVILMLAFSSMSFAQVENVRLAQLNLEKKVAIQGYDPVSYFEQNAATKGSKDFAVNYAGVVYNFSTATNKAIFLKSPAKFEPQYGGWCAYAMGDKGEKVEINPSTFKIINGKLYLFYNAYFKNTLKFWNKDESNLLKKADANWLKFLN